MAEQLRAEALAMPSARAGRAAPRALRSRPVGDHPYRIERHIAKATADLLGPVFYTATDRFGTSGYGNTRKAAIAALERITAWRRK